MSTYINTEIKPFNATAYHNGKFVQVSDADLKGKWSVVFFYPADFTFVCPTELGDLADNYAEFQKLGVEIYSVSTDTHFTHKAWHDTSETIGKIQYPLIGDPTGTITRNFGVMIEEAGLAERGTFVMDHKPGASTSIAARHVARARPDGMMIDQQTAFQTAWAARESRTEYSCTASVAPGASRSLKRRNWASGSARLRSRTGWKPKVNVIRHRRGAARCSWGRTWV